jgi:plasmid stabilization system protein ParE
VKLLSLCLSEEAAGDILEQADWYERQADDRLAARWERSVYRSDFRKHLIFYRIEKDRLVILRIVHGARDLESLF